jgi:hypothetical protein
MGCRRGNTAPTGVCAAKGDRFMLPPLAPAVAAVLMGVIAAAAAACRLLRLLAGGGMLRGVN